jgi:prepilin-type N-terminal cleavage/methylation domain-containing protein
MFGHRQSGYTLLELLIVICIIGLLATLVTGGFNGMLPAGRQEVAVGKARIVNGARVSYALTVPDAATQWAAAATDLDRAQLLISANALVGASAADWLSSPGGYTLALTGGLRNQTVVKDKSGATVPYSN